ncbi:hypothetical protein LINGRAHAP2_LOCUS35401 [Linum grandiflorum]
MCLIMTCVAHSPLLAPSLSSLKKGLSNWHDLIMFYNKSFQKLVKRFFLFCWVCSFMNNPRLEGPQLMGFVRYDAGGYCN